MTLEELIANLTPEMHQQLKRAIELGKWPDGRKLTAEDKEVCMQAVISYEMKHLPEDQRVGFIDEGSKGCLPDWLKPVEEQALKWDE
jgi:hypothetical protein